MPRLEIAKNDDPKLDSTVQAKAHQFLMKLLADDRTPGLNIEKMSHKKVKTAGSATRIGLASAATT